MTSSRPYYGRFATTGVRSNQLIWNPRPPRTVVRPPMSWPTWRPRTASPSTPGGRIRAAYPFPAVPTAHRVQLADGVEVWSVYAVDALSIPGMLGTDAVITSADPVTGETVTVTSTGGRMTWQPSTAPWSTSDSAPAPVLRPRSPAAR